MNSKAKRKVSERRQRLLALVHIAPKDLHISEEDRREILMQEFKVESSRDLDNEELGRLVEYYVSKGWTPSPRTSTPARKEGQWQVEALKDRARQMAIHSELDMARWRGLVRKICNVDDLEWCGDAVRLKRLLAVLKTITEGEKQCIYD